MAPLSIRYYGLDTLRACMLLLGIILHLAIPYTGFPAQGFYISHERSWFLGVAVVVVHYFRMPVFFLLSGFFSALLMERHGARVFLKFRFKRIGLVWLAALVVLWPVVAFINVYSHFAQQDAEPLAKAIAAVTSLQVDANWLQPAPLHLWFLEYLMWFCIAAAVLFSTLRSLLPILDGWTSRVIHWRFRIAALCIPSAASLWAMPAGMARYPDSFLPSLDLVLLYGWFYLVGWLLCRQRDLLPLLASRTQIEKWGLPLFIVAAVLLLQRRGRIGLETSARGFDLAIIVSISLFIWSTLLVLLAASIRHSKPSKVAPYLADASYWIYLSHYPFTCLLPVLMRHWHVSPLVKVALSTALIFAALLLAYDRFVRYTALGRALNGERLRTPHKPLTRAAIAES